MPYPGDACPPGVELTPRGAIAAALLAAGSAAIASGATGLFLHGLGQSAPTPHRLVVPMGTPATTRLDDVKIVRSRTLHPMDAARAERLPTATPARCFVDLVVPPTPPVRYVRALLIEAVQRRLLTTAELAERIAELRAVPGLPTLRHVLASVAGRGDDSIFTAMVHDRLLTEGLRPDPRPATVPTPGRVLHPDITYSALRVAIECDSLRFHGSQHAIYRDDRKSRAYGDAGWMLLRIGWYEFDHAWAGFLGDLRRALGQLA
jgi:hypothetical protein